MQNCKRMPDSRAPLLLAPQHHCVLHVALVLCDFLPTRFREDNFYGSFYTMRFIQLERLIFRLLSQHFFYENVNR